GKSDGPIASTDYAWNESSKKLLDDDGKDYKTAFIPQMDLKKTIVPISMVNLLYVESCCMFLFFIYLIDYTINHENSTP
ncbi:MAG: hypothetical protein VW882_05330, partial [Gammaproteobacteria bacterium]